MMTMPLLLLLLPLLCYYSRYN